MAKISNASGRKKRAIARATVTDGSGSILINSIPLDEYRDNISRMKIIEPLILADSLKDKVNIKVDVHGGGYSAQADAVRLSIAKGLVKYSNDKKLKETYLNYDRNLLIADVRVAESSKPNDSKPRAKRQKSYR
ncbi:30S ribosomal protein S9 [Candidatus Woesearchaeota archaeon]|nr:30S ribosomal protein S9 [Candidatus Woesearchaeota archaeon]